MDGSVCGRKNDKIQKGNILLRLRNILKKVTFQNFYPTNQKNSKNISKDLDPPIQRVDAHIVTPVAGKCGMPLQKYVFLTFKIFLR